MLNPNIIKKISLTLMVSMMWISPWSYAQNNITNSQQKLSPHQKLIQQEEKADALSSKQDLQNQQQEYSQDMKISDSDPVDEYNRLRDYRRPIKFDHISPQQRQAEEAQLAQKIDQDAAVAKKQYLKKEKAIQAYTNHCVFRFPQRDRKAAAFEFWNTYSADAEPDSLKYQANEDYLSDNKQYNNDKMKIALAALKTHCFEQDSNDDYGYSFYAEIPSGQISLLRRNIEGDETGISMIEDDEDF